MKVLFIGNDKSIITGVNGDVRERMRVIAGHFNKLTIVIFTLKQDSLKPVVDGNLEVYPTNSLNRWFFVTDSLKIIKNLHVDLISSQDPFIAGLVGVIAKLLWHKKLNIQVNNDFFDPPYFRKENLQNDIFYWLGKFCLTFADSIRVMAKRMDKKGKYFVATIATDLDRFYQKPHSKIYGQIVTIARLAKQKNLPLLFSVAKAFPNFRFVVIGDGEEKNKLDKIKPKNVFLVGQKNHNEVRDIVKFSDVFLLTSDYEGWGICVAEGLAAGLPVIMTDTGCAGELVVDGKLGGFVISPGDYTGIIRAIKKLYESKKLRTVLVSRGQDNLYKNYSQTKIISQFVDGLKHTI